MTDPITIAGLLAALQGLFKVEASVVKAQEASLIKTGDISAIKEIKELKMSLVDLNNHIQNLTINIIAGGQQVNILGSDADSPTHLFALLEKQRDSTQALVSKDGRSGQLPEIAGSNSIDSKPMVTVPLDTGLHLIVKDPRWFSQNKPFQVNQQYALVPVQFNGISAQVIGILEAGRILSMQFQEEPAQLMINWPADICEKLVIGDSKNISNSAWSLCELPVNQIAALSDDNSQLVSFDPKIVAHVWKLTRRHLAKESPRPVQQFLFIMRNR